MDSFAFSSHVYKELCLFFTGLQRCFFFTNYKDFFTRLQRLSHTRLHTHDFHTHVYKDFFRRLQKLSHTRLHTQLPQARLQRLLHTSTKTFTHTSTHTRLSHTRLQRLLHMSSKSFAFFPYVYKESRQNDSVGALNTAPHMKLVQRRRWTVRLEDPGATCPCI